MELTVPPGQHLVLTLLFELLSTAMRKHTSRVKDAQD